MNTHLTLPFLVALLCGLTSAQPLEFSKQLFPRPSHFAKHQHIEVQADKSVRCVWEASKFNRMEFGIQPGLTFSAFLELQAALTVELPTGSRIDTISIRFKDQEGETFSYPIPLKPIPLQNLEWTITPNSKAITWGD
ncbi:MAG: hypothetical protein J5746_02250, partial [Victivallales bacterium]|nr:hypothetical protein [Victivallales bacterium]